MSAPSSEQRSVSAVPAPAQLLSFFPAPIAQRAATTAADLERLGRECTDVVVIVGSGIGGLVASAKLASLGQRVILVSGRPPVPKRLIAGCSLRRSTLATMAAAFGIEREKLVDRLGRAGSFDGLALGSIHDDVSVINPTRERDLVGLSTRHGAILAALRSCMPQGVDLVAGELAPNAKRDRTLRILLSGGEAELALPVSHIVIDTTPQGLLGASPKREAERFVLACQLPFRASGEPACGGSIGYAPLLLGAPRHLAFFTPFFDRETPDANWYGINTLVVPAARLVDKEALAGELRARLERAGRRLGMSIVEADATYGGAIMPVRRPTENDARASVDVRRRVVATHPTFSPGAVAINVDGMLAESIGATALAGALARGSGDLLDRARTGLFDAYRALAPVRADNLALERMAFAMPAHAVRTIQRLLPKTVSRRLVHSWAELGAET
jgi:hypothetical protein